MTDKLKEKLKRNNEKVRKSRVTDAVVNARLKMKHAVYMIRLINDSEKIYDELKAKKYTYLEIKIIAMLVSDCATAINMARLNSDIKSFKKTFD